MEEEVVCGWEEGGRGVEVRPERPEGFNLFLFAYFVMCMILRYVEEFERCE